MLRVLGALSLAILTCLGSCGQTKQAPSSKNSVKIEKKALLGSWLSEKDANYQLVFQEEVMFEFYGKEKISEAYYKFSSSCNLADSSDKLNLSRAYIIIIQKQTGQTECNEILNLQKGTLSWMNNSNGKIQIFKKKIK